MRKGGSKGSFRVDIAEVLRLFEDGRKDFSYEEENPEPTVRGGKEEEEQEELHPVEQASLLSKEFQKTEMTMFEFVDACQGIQQGRPGYFRIRTDGDMSVWRVLIRGEIMIASYCLSSKRIEQFLPNKDYRKFAQGIRGSWANRND